MKNNHEAHSHTIHNHHGKHYHDNNNEENPPHGHMGHDHHEMMIRDFRKGFWITTLITIPILVFSPMIQMFFGYQWLLPGNAYFLFGLSTFVYFWGGWPFLKGIYQELKEKSPGMMTLISMAISVAYFYSTATVFGLPGQDFFWELATLIDIMLLGHWLEMKSVLGASKALQLLVSMMPSEAHRVKGDSVEDVKLEELEKNDIIMIKPGEKVPADAIIVEGESYLNESMLTGESRPVKKTIDNKVIGGSINGNGSLKAKIEHTGKDSYLKDEKMAIPEGAYSNAAETEVFVMVDHDLAGYIALADQVRPESADAIKIFKNNKIKVMMATGDNETVAKAVADELGLDGYYSEVLPHQKVDIVKELQSKGEFVAMTGDGVNDAPALAQANVGIAVGSGTDIAAETADIVLVNSNPQDIANLILFGKATFNKMIQNLVWATGYNAFAIPLAAGVFYSSGVVLGPAVGAVLMSLSTIIVAINARMLKRKMRNREEMKNH